MQRPPTIHYIVKPREGGDIRIIDSSITSFYREGSYFLAVIDVEARAFGIFETCDSDLAKEAKEFILAVFPKFKSF